MPGATCPRNGVYDGPGQSKDRVQLGLTGENNCCKGLSVLNIFLNIYMSGSGLGLRAQHWQDRQGPNPLEVDTIQGREGQQVNKNKAYHEVWKEVTLAKRGEQQEDIESDFSFRKRRPASQKKRWNRRMQSEGRDPVRRCGIRHIRQWGLRGVILQLRWEEHARKGWDGRGCWVGTLNPSPWWKH